MAGSRAPIPPALVLPPIMDPLYGYEAVNVEAQSRDPHSLLNWMRRMLAVRRQHRAFGRGTLRFLYPKNRKILAYLREYEDETILCVANLARSPQAVELDLSRIRRPRPDRAERRLAVPADRPADLSADPAALRLLLVHPCEAGRLARLAHPGARTHARISDHRACATISSDAPRNRHAALFEQEVLPPYLAKRRWFARQERGHQSGAALLPRAAAGERARNLSRAKSRRRRESATHALAACRSRSSGKASRQPLCRASSPWRMCAASAASACSPMPLPCRPSRARCWRCSRAALSSPCRKAKSGSMPCRAWPTRLEAGPGRRDQLDFGGAVEQLADRRRRGDAQDLPAHHARPASRGRDGPLSDGAAVSPMRRRCWARSCGSRPTAAAPRLAVAQQFVRNQGDAWTWLTDRLLLALDDLKSTEPSEAARGRPSCRLRPARRRDRPAAGRNAHHPGAAHRRSRLCADRSRRAANLPICATARATRSSAPSRRSRDTQWERPERPGTRRRALGAACRPHRGGRSNSAHRLPARP